MAIPQNVILDGKVLKNKDLISPLAFSATEDKQFQLLVEEIKNHITGFEASDLELKFAYQADTRTEDGVLQQIELLDFRNKENTVAINIFTLEKNKELIVVRKARVDTKAADNNLLGFEVIDGEVFRKYAQDGEISEFKQPEQLPNNLEYVPGSSIVAKDFDSGSFCMEDEDNNEIYNHCGPKCGDMKDRISGSGGTPINGIDSCCRAHDRCWSVYGKSDNCCDKILASCIDPYQDDDYYTWMQINSWYQWQGLLC